MPTYRDAIVLTAGFALLAILVVYSVVLEPARFGPLAEGTADTDSRDPGAPVPTTQREMGAYQEAAAYSERHGGLSLLVMREGWTVFEKHAPKHTPDTPHHLASGTKSFWGVAAMCMVEEGLLSLDERAADTLTEWKDDPRKRRITVRQLLDLSGGLAPGFFALQNPRTANKYKYALTEVACKADPGTQFQYGPSHYYALGQLMQRKLADTDDKTPLDYLKRKVLDPIGLEVAEWRHDRTGHPHVPNGASLSTKEWAKFGQLLLQEGRWKEKQIVRADLLAECFQPSQANPSYGLTFWLNRPVPKDNAGTRLQRRFLERITAREADSEGNRFVARDVPHDLVMAAGAGGQRLYILPSRNLVVVRQAESGREFSDGPLLGLLLAGQKDG